LNLATGETPTKQRAAQASARLVLTCFA
jgi:hypothetical protein